MTPRHHTSRTCAWNEPRPHRDPVQRRKHYGPILPADDPRPRGPAFAFCWAVIALAAVWAAYHAVRFFTGG